MQLSEHLFYSKNNSFHQLDVTISILYLTMRVQRKEKSPNIGKEGQNNLWNMFRASIIKHVAYSNAIASSLTQNP